MERFQAIMPFISKRSNKMNGKQQFITLMSIIVVVGGYFFYGEYVDHRKSMLIIQQETLQTQQDAEREKSYQELLYHFIDMKGQ